MTERPALRDIIRRVDNDMGRFLASSSGKGIARALAGCTHLLYGYIRNLADNLHPLRAEGDALSGWAGIWLEGGRKSASPARGVILVKAGRPCELRAGTVFLHKDREFVSMEDCVISESAEIRVKAVKAGGIPVIRKGEILRTARIIPDIVTEARVIQDISGGTDRESDPSLRSRMMDRLRNPPGGGNAQDYIVWAQSVPGISRAWVAPKIHGKGTVGIAFTGDGNEGSSGRSSTELLMAKLEECGPAGAEFVPVLLEAEPVHFRISAEPASARDQMAEELKAMLRELSEPGPDGDRYFLNARGEKTSGVLRLSHIHEALALVPKKSYRLISPDRDLTVSTGKLFTFGGLS
ncbi:MAG: baseplate J/gp47 family protein [Deltaproteobacteria bacterium]|nr:baseplate J/gp47 family protein [Deltaproteobacteria bacterium]